MAQTLKELELIHKDLVKQRYKVGKQIEELKLKKILPKLKKRYEGKYFVSENGYSADRKWLDYLFVREVINERQMIADKILIDCEGKIEFEIKTEMYIHTLKEISKDEFQIQLENSLKSINLVGVL